MNTTFDNKVKSMTASEIIMAMVNGLRNQYVQVDMGTYGSSDDNDVCFGCAATNAICEIFGATIPITHIDYCSGRSNYIGATFMFVDKFETALNHLRTGNIQKYNDFASFLGIATIKNPNNIDLPFLETEDYMYNLQPYIQLAKDNEN